MKKLTAKVIEVSLGHADDEYCMHKRESLQAELDGFVDDRHRSLKRETWAGDKQAEGTIRRNERMWSAMSVEESKAIAKQMDLSKPLNAANLSVNLMIEGIPSFSLLPKGSILKFPSGAELIVEEYNPPCEEMGQKLADTYSTNSGKDLKALDFTQAAIFSRGLVGVIEVAGEIRVGDEVTVTVYTPPIWATKIDNPYLT